MPNTEKTAETIKNFQKMLDDADQDTVLALQVLLVEKFAKTEGVAAVSGGSCESDSC